MKILPILFICSIYSLGKSDQIMSKSEENTSTSTRQRPIRKRLPIFPKNNMKFVVNPHSTYTDKTNIETYGESAEIGTRKPLMVKMVPISKKTSMEAKIAVTRKPLMKVRTYTVKMKPSGKNINEDEGHRKYPRQSKRHYIKTEETKGVSETENFSKEEEEDRHEFIFLENKNNAIVNDILDVSEEDFETTTSKRLTTKLRHKRSSNIIEEENMGTTVSPQRYTGQDTRLTNEIYFKNINH